MNLKIRAFKESDIASVLFIANESFPLPWSIKSFLDELKNPQSIFKVAEIDEEIIGYVIFRIVLDEAELLSIAVKQKFRNIGIATALLSDTIEELKDKVKTCYLEVRVSNQPAISLYKKFGFRVYGVRKNYYLIPEEDALLMRLDL
ncbi:MAG: ribosomal protein S18-alanine N-acetyltransferase [Thermodesulfovibrio sp.]|nr:ribosomal protein S18-alanine N-acetyltransferase [Thermodesulfovibrio sp.]